MTDDVFEPAARLVAHAAGPGEWVEVFVREHVSGVYRSGTGSAGPAYAATRSVHAEVRYWTATGVGCGATNGLDPQALAAALDAARAGVVGPPERWRHPAERLLGVLSDPTEDARTVLPDARDLGAVAGSVAGADSVVVSAGGRRLGLFDSTGADVRFTQSEAQLLGRRRGRVAAGGASGLSRLPVDEVTQDLADPFRHVADIDAPGTVADALVLSPPAAAQLLALVAACFVNGEAPPPLGELLDCHPSLLLVHDGTARGGPDTGPVDDEGTPQTRVVLVQDREVRAWLDAADGVVVRDGWRAGRLAAANLRLAVEEPDEIPPHKLVAVHQLLGRPHRNQGLGDPCHLQFQGERVIGDKAEPVVGRITTSVRALLEAVVAQRGRPTYLRIGRSFLAGHVVLADLDGVSIQPSGG